jgi:hypothetical protein
MHMLLLLLVLLLALLPHVVPAPKCLQVVPQLILMVVLATRQLLCPHPCGRYPSFAPGRACHK